MKPIKQKTYYFYQMIVANVKEICYHCLFNGEILTWETDPQEGGLLEIRKLTKPNVERRPRFS